ncbi:zinc-binding domain-domain-containing protein [Clohesyomyces aquaticus]|uniref:Zinc-binding domain-domain-containing protein n=1 Tax=Clohesyomyces aquaticus TaxID=1231657 RepID=A0A1Y1YLE5_9PLEO|nr:zinc-binding domain-domain-containing protein [Clohesyomyces aquaticus]
MPPKTKKPTAKEKPTATKKTTRRSKPIKKWSMYPSLDDEVSNLLREDNLVFTFHPNDEENTCLNGYDTNVMGRFACRNKNCTAVWTSKQIAITIRRYPNERYNARVYHQSCKRCLMTFKPQLDHESYAERVAYRIKKWCGVKMEAPPFKGRSDGPHRSDLCEGCKQGRCSKM